MLNGTANFLETGRQLRERGLTVPARVDSRFAVFDVAIKAMQSERPLYLEFGVFEGEATRYWSEHLQNPNARFVGFDSFEGLPEDWTAGARRGHFSTGGQIPQIADARVGFVKGWFDESLASFEAPPHDRLCLNIDCDLYSSAATVLTWSAPLLNVGDLIYFDEFHDRLNEGRAFGEYLDQTGFKMEILAATRGLNQLLLRRVA